MTIEEYLDMSLMHQGRVVFEKDNYKIIDCDECGFKHLIPIPSEDEINNYYSFKYFDEIRKGEKGLNLKHYLDGGADAIEESEWMKKTEFRDVSDILSELLSGESRNICDVGCGSGDFLNFILQDGWTGIGIEPSKNSGCGNPNLPIFNNSFESFLIENPDYKKSFDAVTLLGVLEHATNPQKMLEDSTLLLKDDGIICIKVPNDFSELQKSAQTNLNIDPWWIGIPDHINYFSMNSLEKLLKKHGFSIVHKSTDFPMEFFLLMGDNYVNNPKIGSSCHNKRRLLENSIPSHLRRNMYTCLAQNGIGRNSLFFAKYNKN